MRRTVALLAFTLLPLALCRCECGDGGVTQSAPDLRIEPSALEFGTVCVGDTRTLPLVLRNVGAAPLEFSQVAVDGAGYTLVDAPADVGPQSLHEMGVAFTPSGPDDVVGTLHVDSNDPDQPSAQVTLSGNGFAGKRKEFFVTCPVAGGGNGRCAFLDFYTYDGAQNRIAPLAGTEVTRTATLRNKGCGELHVNEIRFRPIEGAPAADAQLFVLDAPAPPLILRGGETTEMSVRFVSPGGEASNPGVEAVLIADDPDQAEWTLGLFAESVAPSLGVEPDALTFFDASEGVPTAKSFTIVNRGSGPLEVQSVDLVPEGGTQDFVAQPAGGAAPFTMQPSDFAPGGADERVVNVTYTASGQGSDKAHVEVASAAGQTASVLLVGGAFPRLRVEWKNAVGQFGAPPVDFGETATGARGLFREVRIVNDGKAALLLRGISLSWNPGGGFGLAELPATFPIGVAREGGSLQFKVTFDDAVRLRDDRAKLAIETDDPLFGSAGGVAEFDVTSRNEPNFDPVADFLIQGAARVGQPLGLDASPSTGPEAGDTLSFAWVLARKPEGSTAKLSSANTVLSGIVSETANLTGGPDRPGDYLVVLTVTDQFGSFGRKTTLIRVQP
jgi:hypothetical protein